MTELHLWFTRNMAKTFEVESRNGLEAQPVQNLYFEHQAWTAMIPAQYEGIWRIH